MSSCLPLYLSSAERLCRYVVYFNALYEYMMQLNIAGVTGEIAVESIMKAYQCHSTYSVK